MYVGYKSAPLNGMHESYKKKKRRGKKKLTLLIHLNVTDKEQFLSIEMQKTLIKVLEMIKSVKCQILLSYFILMTSN